jgi:hypothetical protein
MTDRLRGGQVDVSDFVSSEEDAVFSVDVQGSACLGADTPSCERETGATGLPDFPKIDSSKNSSENQNSGICWRLVNTGALPPAFSRTVQKTRHPDRMASAVDSAAHGPKPPSKKGLKFGAACKT